MCIDFESSSHFLPIGIINDVSIEFQGVSKPVATPCDDPAVLDAPANLTDWTKNNRRKLTAPYT